MNIFSKSRKNSIEAAGEQSEDDSQVESRAHSPRRDSKSRPLSSVVKRISQRVSMMVSPSGKSIIKNHDDGQIQNNFLVDFLKSLMPEM